MPIQIQNLSRLNVSAQTILRFSVAFQNIQFAPYGEGNPAPIGIRVIGLDNYIA